MTDRRRDPEDELPFSLERSVIVRARRQTVFRFFTDSGRFASWWGAGSSIDARPGGRVVIRYPGGAVASGEVVEIDPGRRIVFTYGYEDPSKPIPPGGSRVTVTLVDRPAGTEVRLRHDVSDAAVRDDHAPGWRFQLSLFANVAARAAIDDPAAIADAWFAAWNEKDPAARRAILDRAVDPAIAFHDSFACISGTGDLEGHIAASQLHMPGTLARDGEVSLCQGTMVAPWIVRAPDGSTLATGRNVFDLDADGRIVRVVGFWTR
jgi:uncharacterized protein YndB with AHSA1/START domain